MSYMAENQIMTSGIQNCASKASVLILRELYLEVKLYKNSPYLRIFKLYTANVLIELS